MISQNGTSVYERVQRGEFDEQLNAIGAAPIVDQVSTGAERLSFWRRYQGIAAFVGAAVTATAVVFGINASKAPQAEAVSVPSADEVDQYVAAAASGAISANTSVVTVTAEGASNSLANSAAVENTDVSSQGSSSQGSESFKKNVEKIEFTPFHYDATFDPANHPGKEFTNDYGVSLKGETVQDKFADELARLQMSPVQVAVMHTRVSGEELNDAKIDAAADAMKKDPALWQRTYKDILSVLDKDTTTIGLESIPTSYTSLYIQDGKIGKADNLTHGGSVIKVTFTNKEGKADEMKLRIECGGQDVWYENEQTQTAYITKTVEVTKLVNHTVTETVNHTNTVTSVAPGTTETQTINHTNTVVSTAPGTTETVNHTNTVTETPPATTVTVTETTSNGKGEVPVTHTTTATETATTTETAPGTTVTETAPGTTTTVTVTTTPNGKGEVPPAPSGAPTNG